MLRLFLRVFVLAISGLCVALWLTPFVLQHYYADEANNYFHDALRGPFGTIVEQLEPLPEAGRAQHVQELTQRYNWKMSLRDPLSEPVSEIERDQLLAGQFISRDDQQEFMVPVPASATARAQWLFVRMPQSPEIGWRVISVGLMAISVVVGGFLLLWVWPTWRDLEALTLAARRMGEGDLKVRARVSGFSGVGRLAGHFNQMSDRIAALIGRQRELTNAVSHELRTPISRLSFELDLLAQEGTTDSGRALIRDMHDDLRELDELVAELLLHARLEHPHEDAPLEPVPSGPWLDQCLAQVALEARARGLDCALVAYPAQEVLLHPRFMTRALVNLLRNALRYAQTRVQVSLQLDVDGNARLYVEDDGPGIAPTDRLRVLQPFTRLDESRDRATGGTGLGLAIVERVARWHQGRLSIDDSPSLGGARVMLEWPQAH